MKRPSLAVSAFVACVLSVLAYFSVVNLRAAEKTPLATFSGTGRPFMDAQSAHPLALSYSGDASAVAALTSGAKPTALTSADFDADGAPDLVAGYSTASGGVVTITRGNPDAFAPKDTRWYARALKGQMPPEFLSKTLTVSVPESPDFLAAADFDGDGYQDILVAKRGGGMYLLSGDGQGNFAAARRIDLPGDVTTLAVADSGHIAVGIQSGSNHQLLIFDPRSSGALVSPVSTRSLPAPATSIVWGRLSYNTTDLAVAVGNSITVYYNVLKSDEQSDTIEAGFHVQALAADVFVWNRDSRLQIAALADDGSIHVFQHGALDARPLTKADIPGRRAHFAAMSKMKNLDPTALGAWKESSKITGAASSTEGVSAQSMLQSSRLLPGATAGLMILDRAQKHIGVVNSSATSQSLSVFDSPVAAHTMPAMLTGRRSIAVVTASQVAPVVVNSGPDPTLNVNTTADIDATGACTNPAVTGTPATLSLREAVCLANNNGGTYTINVPAGTYTLTSLETGEIQAGATGNPVSISIVGAAASTTIIQQGDGVDRLFEQDFALVGSSPLSFSNLTLQNGKCTNNTTNDCAFGGGAVLAGGVTGDTFTLTNVTLNNNSAGVVTSDPAAGGAVNGSSEGNIVISSSTFTNNTSIQEQGGALAFAPDPSSGNLTITSSTFTSNTTSGNEGGALSLSPDTGNAFSITGSTFTLNSVTGTPANGGAIYTDGAITLSNSRIVGNTAATSGKGFYADGTSGNSTITNNWWGCNAGPGNAGCDSVGQNTAGLATFNPWLVLSISTTATQLQPNQTATLTADLSHNSASASGFSVPDGTGVAFGGTLGTDNPTSSTFASGTAATTFTAGFTQGVGSGTATVDNQTVSVAIDVVSPPIIFSANNTTFTVGTAGSFTVTVSAFPTAAITESGALPSGVTLTDNGNDTATLSGTPAANSGGTYAFTITANNGVAPNATQSFTLTVNQAPAITSANNTTFTLGTLGSFTVTTTGFPTAAISKTGALPTGVNLTDNGNGTATLTGTPAAGTGGTYPITITAANGVSPNATQSFTLTVNQAPAITSANSTTFTVGTLGTFTVTASGSPAPTFSETGALPGGVTLSPAGVLTGTPGAGSGGTYSITITAANGISPNATQSFTLTVDQAPAITSANATSFTEGSAGSFQVTATGFPSSITFGETGALPTGVTFTTAGLLSGTPVRGTAGSYPLTITASNGVSPNATQSFTLTVLPGFTTGSFSPTAYSLITPINTTSPTYKAILTNTGSALLQISSANLTGSGVGEFSVTPSAVNGCGASVPVGTSCSYDVSFSPTSRTTVTAAFTVTFNGGTAVLNLTGRSPIGELTPGSASMGMVLLGQNATKNFTLTNTSTTDTLNVTGLGFSGAQASEYQAAGCASPVAPGTSCNITVTFAPTVEGSASAVLLVSNDGGITPLRAGLIGTGAIGYTSVKSIFYGTKLVGTSTQKTFTINNASSTNTLNVTGMSFSGAGASQYGVSGCIGSIGPLSSCTVTVTFAPTAKGVSAASLNIANDGGNSPMIVSVEGSASIAQLSTTGLSFGYDAIGNPVQLPLTITNVSTTDTLDITSLTFSGAGAGSFFTGGCPTIPASTSCTFSVTFAPNATGTQEGFLVIGNDGGVTPLQVEVVGVGH